MAAAFDLGGQMGIDSETSKKNAGDLQNAIRDLQAQSGPAFWSKVREINALFKATKPLLKADREALWAEFSEICRRGKEKREREQLEFESQAKANKEKLSGKIANLQDQVDVLFGKPKFSAIWSEAKEISQMFKTLRPLAKADRQMLWDQYGNLCEKIRQMQANDKKASAYRRECIEQRFDEARSAADDAGSIEELQKAMIPLHEGFGFLTGKKDNDLSLLGFATMFLTIPIGPLLNADEELRFQNIVMKPLFKEDREACWELYKATKESIRVRRSQLGNATFEAYQKQAWDAMKDADYGEAHSALEKVKEMQAALKTAGMTRDQRQTLRDLLGSVWEKAVEQLKKKREEGERKHQGWINQMQEKMERLTALIEKNVGVIERLQEQIDDLEEKARNARTDDFAETVRGWIREKYDKIRDIEATNKELTAKIEEIEEKVRGDR